MTTQTEVRDNAAESRFELAEGGAVAIAAYEIEGKQITFTHTVVPSEMEGQGVGSRLIAGALAQVRMRGLKIVPQCTFVESYIERHPDTQDLLA